MSTYDSDFLNGLHPSEGDTEPTMEQEPIMEPAQQLEEPQQQEPAGDLSFDITNDPFANIEYDPEVETSGLNTDVDIVFVIDATGSMVPFIERVKNEALYFMPGLEAALAEKKRVVRQVRLKVILFRDFYCDDAHLIESPFFVMPDQQQEYANFLSNIEASGGGDMPENSLEALALAIKSRWSSDPAVSKRRQVIALFTDTVPHPLDSPKRNDPRLNQKYPSDLSDIRSLDDLQMLWLNPQVISASGKRLALFVPDDDPWTTIKTWNLVVPGTPLQQNKGGEEASMNLVYMFIANSV